MRWSAKRAWAYAGIRPMRSATWQGPAGTGGDPRSYAHPRLCLRRESDRPDRPTEVITAVHTHSCEEAEATFGAGSNLMWFAAC